MTQAIKKWVTESTGILMNMNPDIFAVDVMDGTILAQLLFSYNIINQEQLDSVLPTDKVNIALHNLKRIAVWLKAISIDCTTEQVEQIATCKTLSAVKLFYQLYLALHDKDKLHFATKNKIRERLHPSNTRFDVAPVDEFDEDLEEVIAHPLSDQLISQRGVIEWNQNRYAAMLQNYEAMRIEYQKYIQNKFDNTRNVKFGKIRLKEGDSVNLSELDIVVEKDAEFTYEELALEEESALKMEQFKADPRVAKKILAKIKQKRRSKMKEKETKLHEQKVFLIELWEKLLNEQEKEFEETISKKLLKQSLFEKQMATKMLEVRKHKHNMMYNRRFMDDETMKKREEEFVENVFFREKNMEVQKYNYYFERDRMLELHRRLYAKKLRLRKERYSNMCHDIMRDLVNISIRHSEYKDKYNEEVPERVQKELAGLFVKQQPIFNLVDDVTDIVQDGGAHPKDLEEIYCKEIHRQNQLDQYDFENYCNFDWPWKLEDLVTGYEEDLYPIECGLNVLGHNVHRVLLTKYPRPKVPPKPNLPAVTAAVCINGIPDVSILSVLQKLLDKREIRIIEMQDAINYCLDEFKKEITTEFIDDVLNEETDAALKELNKTGKGGEEKPQKGAKTVAKDQKQKGLDIDDSAIVLPQFDEKQCQTPRLYPCEEIVLSPKGELGKTAYDLLNIGEQLTDNLVVAMFVEYLKSLQHIKGWALINFPTNLAQAALLEEALTGIQIPEVSEKLKLELSKSIGDIADLKYRESQWDLEEKNAKHRKSKIVPNPPPIFDEIFYKTYLTAYINIQHKDKVGAVQLEDDVNSESGEAKEPQTLSPLEEFYSDQGCNYAFSYDTFEFAAVKHLAKLIIGEYTLPPKTSVELFGNTVLYIGANLNEGRASPGKESKSSKKEAAPKPVVKIVPPGKGANVAVIQEDKEVQVPEIEPEVEVIYVEPPPEPRAGEALWRYTDLEFPDYFQTALATLWENLEDVYSCDFKESFFIKRVIWNSIVPYLTYVRKHMEIFITRPDDKQTYLHQFQTIYNEIDEDMRDDVELKAEVHCRISELREKLCHMCDNRMKESEDERQRIIHENWVTMQACELTNHYITNMQLELDRCCDTFQFVTDYYHGVITKMPSEDPPISKTFLPKIAMAESKISFTSTGGILKDAVTSILTNPETDSIETLFHTILKKTLGTAISAVAKWKTESSSYVTKLDAMLKPGKKGGSVKDKGSKKGEKKLPKFVDPAVDVQEAGPNLIEEWQCAIHGEHLRANLRLNVITQRGLTDLDEVLRCSQKTFYGVYKSIAGRYNREIQSVNKACEVLTGAVEAEISLQPELVFDGDQFYIDPNILLYPEPLPKPDLPLKEKYQEGVFTIIQLDKLTDYLIGLAPNGSMPERNLVFLIQDMIVQNAEDGEEPMVPNSWLKLKPQQVSYLIANLFGDVEFVDWRDFIIYNLCLRFPTEDQLLETRIQFRDNDPDATETVKDYQFYNVKFWFETSFAEEDEQDMFRLKSIKVLLFKIFKINEDTINYTTLLLAFCKDVNPMKGLAKALALVFGRCVCLDIQIGNMYLLSVREQRILDELKEAEGKQKHEEAIQETESIMDSLIDTTVHVCESVLIEDYVSEETITSENRKRSSLSDVPVSSTAEVEEVIEELFSNPLSNVDSTTRQNESLLMEDLFSNIEIGFQSTYDPTKVYLLSFDAILTVITASLPWHARAQTENDHSIREKLEVVFNSLKSGEFHKAALAHEFLNSPLVKEVFLSNFKFVEKSPPEIVENLTNVKC